MKLDLARFKSAAYELHAARSEPLCAYLYDLAQLRKHASQLVTSLPPNCEMFYAIKANSDLPILQTLANEVHGFEVASGGELEWVREHFPSIPVIFGGPGKTDEELQAGLAHGVEYIHVESVGELERLAWITQQQGRNVSVLLRINLSLDDLPQTTLTMGGRPTPFGIDAQQLPPILEWLTQQPQIRLCGFHFHMLSHQLDAEAHLRLLQCYFDQVVAWKSQYQLDIHHINVGGGIGINYREPGKQFDWNRFSRGLSSLIQGRKMENYCIRFELGRYVTAGSGCYVMEVLDIKESLGRQFVIARGGTHHFRTPYAQGHSHPFHVLPVKQWPYPFARRGVSQCAINVVGQLCTPKDVLVTETDVEQVRVGDMLLFPYAGAYAWHISHHDFLRHPHPQHLYLQEQEEFRRVANQ
ncbi:MAG: type III PLP-dependent enzyme [Pseudomonadota bacterium]|nr:type III PLP-dependent enzyme [Pseudomonadota bacterium]